MLEREETQEHVLHVLGDPFLKFPDPSEPYEVWFYLNNRERPSVRCALIFNSVTREMMALNWHVDERDPEANLAAVKARYHGVEFSPSERWISSTPDGHHRWKEKLYQDKTGSITIEVRPRTEKVTMIVLEKNRIASDSRIPSSKTR